MNRLPGKASKIFLIIGSSSFLAKDLIKKLSIKNLVLCIDKDIKKNSPNKNVFYFKCDVNNYKNLEKIQKKLIKNMDTWIR